MKPNRKTLSKLASEPGHGPRAIILIAGGFDEPSVALMMSQMRDSGQGVAMVSTATGLIRGKHGLAVRPDYSLESMPSVDKIQLVCLPGGKRSAVTLLADPRVHQLIDQVLARDGRLSILSGADAAFAEAGQFDLLADDRCWLHGGEELEVLTERMLDYLAAWQPVKE